MDKTITCGICGAEVVCTSFTNRCKCGAFYNWGGQRLADPSQWGEETGEAFDSEGNYVIGSGDPDFEPEEVEPVSFGPVQGENKGEVAFNILYDIMDKASYSRETLRKQVTTMIGFLMGFQGDNNEVVADLLRHFEHALQSLENEEQADAERIQG